MIGELAFAFMIGSIATVNPCGFALLPAYLARRLGSDGAATLNVTNALPRAFAVGAVTTGGFIVVFGGIGGAVSLGAFWISSTLPWAGLIIGLALAATGLVVLAGRDVKLRLLTVKPAGSGLRGDFLFGVGYGVASLSCTLPVFLAVTGTAVTGGMIASVFSFVAYAFGMGTILTALAVGAALSRGGLAAVLGRLRPYMNRAAGAILFLAGTYVATFWGTAIFTPEPTGIGPVVLIGEDLSRVLRSALAGPMGRTVTYTLLALLITLLAWTVRRRVSSKIAGSRSSLPSARGERELVVPPRRIGDRNGQRI